jgi:O-antigen/teichoic acid export membrane protein
MSLKTLGKNTLIYAFGNIGLRAASFFVIPVYAHSLSLTEFGLLMIILTTVQVMIIFMDCGMRTTLIRFLKEYEDKKLLNILLGSTSFINLIAGLIVTFISFAFLTPFFQNVLHTKNIAVYLSLSCGAALAHSLCHLFLSYYRATNQAMKFMIVSVASAILLLITTAISLYLYKLGIAGAMAAYIITYISLLGFLLIDIFSKTGISISTDSISRFFHFGFPFIFFMSGHFVMAGANLYFLSFMVGVDIVGIYSIGTKLAQIMYIVVVLPFQLAFQPYLLNSLSENVIEEKIGKAFNYLVVGMILMSFFVVLASRVLIPMIAPPEYSSSFSVMLLLLPISILNGIYVYSETLVIGKNKTKVIAYIMLICAVLTVALNFLLIPALNWYGAVLASSITFLLASFTLLFIGTKDLKIKIDWKNLKNVFFMFIIFILTEFIFQKNNNLFFYTYTFFFMFLTMTLIYISPLCGDKEKIILRNISLNLKNFIKN